MYKHYNYNKFLYEYFSKSLLVIRYFPYYNFILIKVWVFGDIIDKKTCENLVKIVP